MERRSKQPRKGKAKFYLTQLPAYRSLMAALAVAYDENVELAMENVLLKRELEQMKLVLPVIRRVGSGE